MKETGIIMSGDHPKLILDGIKTMTRRVIKPQPNNLYPLQQWIDDKPQLTDIYVEFPGYKYYKCPYGQVGDSLWVKETFLIQEQLWVEDHYEPDGRIYYRADTTNPDTYKGYWKPSRFMPRWASRITLEITGIRVERLQEIELTDIDDELYIPDELIALPDNKGKFLAIQQLFIDLWDSLNAKRDYGWDKNPYVWVISFKEVGKG